LSSNNFYFFVSNSLNFYEFIGFVTFNIAVHELIFVYSFLLDRILVAMVPCATARALKPKISKNLKHSSIFPVFSALAYICLLLLHILSLRSIQFGISLKHRPIKIRLVHWTKTFETRCCGAYIGPLMTLLVKILISWRSIFRQYAYKL